MYLERGACGRLFSIFFRLMAMYTKSQDYDIIHPKRALGENRDEKI